MERTYICIDLKSYYASVECVHRGLDPLKANLLVADESRSDQTICLAVSPSLKAIGVPGRPRLFEAKQAIRMYEAQHHTKVEYIIAVPRMAEYERISAKIYSIYLRYVAQEDIHVYSIDECFIDVTGYLHAYRKDAAAFGTNPAHLMLYPQLGEMARNNGKVQYVLDFDVTPHQLRHTYITNLIAAGVDPKTVQYLAGHENSKITMDIYAKVKYNKPEEVAKALEGAFALWEK